MDELILHLTKVCTKCGQELPSTLDHFYAKKKGKYGLYPHCKKCHIVLTRPNVDAWKRANPERAKNYQIEYQIANSEKLKEKDLKRYYADPKKAYQRTKQARSNNPLPHRASEHRRRAQKSSSNGTHTADDLKRLMAQSKGRCYWCGEMILGKPHIDHIIPLARGGGNGPENLCVSCPTCNLRKGAKLPHEWTDRLF